MLKSISIVLVALSLPLHALAEIPAGTTEPAFKAAMQAWLDDDDQRALPALARLASDGNTAAQILLGRIEKRPFTSTAWLDGLSRKDRRAIFRAPGGTFGKPWLKIAAKTSTLARALYASSDPAAREAVVPRLVALGEDRAAGVVVSQLMINGAWKFVQKLAVEGQLPPDRRYEAWYAAAFEKGEARDPLLKQAIAAARQDSPQGLMFLAYAKSALAPSLQKEFAPKIPKAMAFAYGPDPDAGLKALDGLGRYGLEADRTGQLTFTCRAYCPKDPGGCAATALAYLGGYTAYLELGSPVETLIPAETYGRSARARQELSNRLAAAPGSAKMAERSACLAEGVRTTASVRR